MLDLVLTSNEALADNVNIEEPFVSSDHCVVKFDITCNISRKDWKLFYDYSSSTMRFVHNIIDLWAKLHGHFGAILEINMAAARGRHFLGSIFV